MRRIAQNPQQEVDCGQAGLMINMGGRSGAEETISILNMLDFELAEIYGYTTSAFNQQVKRNEERFDADFRFQLTPEETEELSISQNVISIQTKGKKGGRAKIPWCFTESGVYMLMTVLKNDTAVAQSKALIRTFRAMKEYIVENRNLVSQRDFLRLSMQTTVNTEAVRSVIIIFWDTFFIMKEADVFLQNCLMI